jgi:hypothetical protein
MDRTNDIICNSMNAGLEPALSDVRELVGFAPKKNSNFRYVHIERSPF